MSVSTDFTFPLSDVDDADFWPAIFELEHDPVHFNADRLSSSIYNPLFSNADITLTQSPDLDPDNHLQNENVNNCNYFIEDQFNDVLTEEASHLSGERI